MASAATNRSRVQEPSKTQDDHSDCLTKQPGSINQDVESRPCDVTTDLNYFKVNEDDHPHVPDYSHDIRGNEFLYALDTNGFQIVKHASKERDFINDEQIKRICYPEIEELLGTVVFIFNHTVRRGTVDSHIGCKPLAFRGPIYRVHIDQSYTAGPKRVSHHLPDEAPALFKGRYQIINVWRPIKTILKDPLGVAEAGSVEDSGLVSIKLIYQDKEGETSSLGKTPQHNPDEEGETFSVRASLNHRWYYLYKQTPEEVLLIKCFDSKTDGRARRVPHTAFVNEEHEDKPERESIEIRALVFHPDDSV
ncbi:uncharacterized protein BCR38DRAFT_504051 [Pseudomassariella vexata]|uniref:Methyltransferase n=1 Tax=Pseudomassariella vexata TaxID=1141098 RepID=A0A1Y2EGC2_9PEZI|nr:uncharacterized protein BCR38DRAFT_504051 [Pseudomassariella vexata]ORY70467.1 hypothetical protein BCR38DRAFT_504051 [Pseudomassariella vexata]